MTDKSLLDNLSEDNPKASGPITCLGLTFENEEARRAHFIEELRKKLQDPEFRKIEGFPIGTDEAILNLSDPPYYTACPNPWLADFIAEWEAAKPEKQADYKYHREPFASDVSEGKNDPIYNAHSYHTKVPHKAIMRYILHYTEPGDIVFDGFCGTGMTGVAAQMCGDRDTVVSLGYQVKPDGTILREEENEEGKKTWVAFSQLGARKAVLNDLSPAATFIAYNYNTPVDVSKFEHDAKRILKEVEEECGWMYKTQHSDGSFCFVDYYVWSEIFSCPNCSAHLVFSEVALEFESGLVKKNFTCSKCHSVLNKNDLNLYYEDVWDDILKQDHRQPARALYLVVYKKDKTKYSKRPDSDDLHLWENIKQQRYPNFPPVEIPDMQMMRVGRMKPSNITHLHHFYMKRPLLLLSLLWEKAKIVHNYDLKAKLIFFVEQATWGLSILARYTPTHFSQVNQYLSGVFYMASHIVDVAPNYILGGKIKRLTNCFLSLKSSKKNIIIGSQDTAQLPLADETIDYAFIDPPFGENIYYSDLNILIESLLEVVTNNRPEAIIDRVKGKSFLDYQELITNCFKRIYQALKPGRWLTVEFSNSSASIWNLIQTSISNAGFVVSNVSMLDKQHRSFQSIVSPTAVKQDLVISAYKPNGGFEERFLQKMDNEEGVWEFIRTHLGYLPVTKMQGPTLQNIPERDPRILFDQMVAYYVRKGYQVPISSQDFQRGLRQRFSEEDGLFFLNDQAAEYRRKRHIAGSPQQGSLFVKDESSAIEWLTNFLKSKPQTYQDIHPHFLQELGGWSKNEIQLELSTLLEQNFLKYDGKGPVPEQIHAYLSSNWKDQRNRSKDDPELQAKAKDRWYVPDPNKAGDLEQLREKALLKEFQEYKASTKKQLKPFRSEAVRAGFKKAWQEHDYATIVAIAKKIPSSDLEEDPKLLMWYDQALTRIEN